MLVDLALLLGCAGVSNGCLAEPCIWAAAGVQARPSMSGCQIQKWHWHACDTAGGLKNFHSLIKPQLPSSRLAMSRMSAVGLHGRPVDVYACGCAWGARPLSASPSLRICRLADLLTPRTLFRPARPHPRCQSSAQMEPQVSLSSMTSQVVDGVIVRLFDATYIYQGPAGRRGR